MVQQAANENRLGMVTLRAISRQSSPSLLIRQPVEYFNFMSTYYDSVSSCVKQLIGDAKFDTGVVVFQGLPKNYIVAL